MLRSIMGIFPKGSSRDGISEQSFGPGSLVLYEQDGKVLTACVQEFKKK
jgi:hypothetical protein